MAKSYNIDPDCILKCEKEILEKGPEVITRDGSTAEYEAQIAQLEQLLGKKELEIVLQKNLGPG